jgi:hypothetical protein
MKTKVLFFFLLIQSVGFAQEMWRSLGDDDFNRASCGATIMVGRNPVIVRNSHVFFFNIETPDYGSTNSHFSISKYNGNYWEHINFPYLFSSTPTIECAVGSNEVPYVLFNDASAGNLPVVKKFESGNWSNVGTGISASTSSFLNIAVGSDNLPQILFREGNEVKLKKFDGSNWILLSESTEFIPYTSISLELDNNNAAYVLSNYQVGATYNCFLRKFNGTAWEEVGITGFTDRGTSLAFDNSNIPYLFVGYYIKKLNGSTWENLSPVLSGFPVSVNQGLNLFFDSSNTLHASFLANYYLGSPSIYVKKLVNSAWETVVANGFIYDKVYTVSGDSTYALSYGPDNYPDVYKITAGQSVKLGGSTFPSARPFSDNEYNTHDFSVCNGIPMIAYSNSKASVRMFVNGNWDYLWGPEISENNVGKVIVKSGTDGKIYVAYNNRLSSDNSDTKLTVKQLNATGWQALEAVNFSQSAGAQFDFKLSHSNVPYVLYMSGRVQKFDGTNWVYVGGSAYTGDVSARLALDASDVPYIAYRDPSNSSHIAVKKLNGNVWEYVDQAGLAAYTGQQYHPRILFDALNNLYLGFTDSASKMHVKRLNNGVWESVGADFFTTAKTEECEMSVDHNNVLYVTYSELEDNFRAKAKVKKFNGTNWELVGEPNFSPTANLLSKIDFSENNTPIVCYSAIDDNNQSEIHTRYFGELNALSVSKAPVTNSQTLFLAPNPTATTFSVIGNKDIEELEIFDLRGKKVFSQSKTSQDINVATLSSGVYIVKVKTDKGISSLKLVKQ